MPSWYIKAAIQGVLSALPQSHRWNYMFQRNISRRLRLTDRYFERKLKNCAQHLQNYQTHRNRKPAHVVELGTGWLPIIPVGFYLSGLNRVISIDVNPLIRDVLVYETLQHFVRYADEGRLEVHIPGLVMQRIDIIREIAMLRKDFNAKQALEAMNIKIMVEDAANVDIQDVDLFVSNSTLEHIPPDVIERIFTNFHRILSPDGMMSHLIDLSDHYWHFDQNITAYNFLKYTESQWRIYNNALHYQNRLRISDYRAIHERSNFIIVDELNKSDAVEKLQHLSLAPEFRDYTPENLAVTESFMTSEVFR